MARGVGTDAARARTITVYTDVAKAVRELGLPGTDTIAVLLVDRSGRIRAREHGGYDDEKTTRLTAALDGVPVEGAVPVAATPDRRIPMWVKMAVPLSVQAPVIDTFPVVLTPAAMVHAPPTVVTVALVT